jgi:hypothetical protein
MIAFFLGVAAVSLPLRFQQLPLGSVARVLSAQYHIEITILAEAAAPVSGDFSQLTLAQSLAESARQAGLVVRIRETGYELGLPPPPVPPPADSKARPPATRAELLRRRAELLQQAAKLTAP